MWTILFVTFHVLGLLSAIDAVMNTRTSPGAIGTTCRAEQSTEE